MVELLLTSGVGLEEVDIEGRSPADMAAHLGYHRVLTLLTGGTLSKGLTCMWHVHACPVRMWHVHACTHNVCGNRLLRLS